MAARQSFPAHPASAAAVRRALVVELDRVLLRLPPRSAPAADDVHEVRKSLKRARAMLRLLRPALDARVFERGDEDLRDAGRRLAAARDARVLADLYERLTRRDPAAGRRVRRSPSNALPGLPAVSVPDAKAARVGIRAARRRLARARLADLGWATLGPGFRAVYRQARRRMPRDPGTSTVAALHAWRRATKRYWHALEVFEPVRPRKVGKAVRDAHRLSDLLGDDHDLALLARRIVARRLQPQPADARVLRDIRSRREVLQVKAFEVGARLYAERPRQVEASLHGPWKRWRRRAQPTGVRRQIRRRNVPITGSKRG